MTLSHTLKKKKTDDWIKAMNEAAIPCGPLNFVNKVVVDPQVLWRNMIINLEHQIAGPIKVVGNPIKRSGFKDGNFKASPVLGEHTGEILKKYLRILLEMIGQLKKVGTID